MDEVISGIYCIKNKIDGKRYVGQSKHIYRRWKKHKWELNKSQHINAHLQRAWDKCGESNFEFEILELCEQDVIDERERFYINLYKCLDQKYGYNLESGGHNYKKLSESTKNKLKKGLEKANAARQRPVVQYDALGNQIRVFHSGKEASEITGASKTGIYSVCKGINKSAGGFQWRYADENIKNCDSVIIKSRRPVTKGEVVQYNLNGSIIQVYKNATIASNKTGISRSCIGAALNDSRKQNYAGGYLWSFYGKDIPVYKKEYTFYDKPVIQYDLNGNKIKEFRNVYLAESFTNIKREYIVKVCKGQAIKTKEFQWRFKNDSHTITPTKSKTRKVAKYTTDNILLDVYGSIKEAATTIDSTSVLKNRISRICSVCSPSSVNKTAYGYIWKYAD